jgi:hypothetical protein
LEADELVALPRYQWCLHQPVADDQPTQFVAAPPLQDASTETVGR